MGRLGRSLIRSLNQDIRFWKRHKHLSFFRRISYMLYLSDFSDPVLKPYYAICSFIDNVKRLIEYAPLVWRHRNWDYGFVLDFNIKLHEDLYKGCYVDGHAVFTKYEARKLKTVIELYKRLHNENYAEGNSKYLDRKYGKDEMTFEKVEGSENKPLGPYSTICFSRDKLPPEQLKVYNKERKALWELEEYQKKQDLTLLMKYITKYSGKWWD